MNLSPNDHLMSASIDRAETFHSAHSDTTYTPSAISPVDEKPGMSQIELNKTSPTLREGYEDLPPAVPRFPNANGGHGRPSSQFTPGHISRGSIALQAAAEGKIPKKEGLKMWRSDEHHGTFTRGGRAKTCLRCTCCTVICAFILIVGVCAAFLLWVRPPNVAFRGVESPSVGVTSNGFNLNLTLDIAVSNPNFFGASFSRIEAKAYYPTNTSKAVGGGVLNNVRIPPSSHNTLYFPFNIDYTKQLDPNSLILQDIATKCGFIGDQKSNIKVNYDLTLGLKIIFFTISPTFSSSTSFPCPLDENQIKQLTSGTNLGGLFGGGS
ncbi:hypothetical protein EMMF5_003250 [Cystobasidiomycetes sp. EMM_F5]